MLTIIALLVLTSVLMWVERAERFRTLGPLERNLQRASHGAELVVLI